MSVKAELERLKKEREPLLEKLQEVRNALLILNDQKGRIVQKMEALSSRTSSLAKELYQRKQEDLKRVNDEISLMECEEARIKKMIDENKESIVLREDDPTMYIMEQAFNMINEFMDYIEKHKEEIGESIKRTFYIAAITSRNNDRYYDYYTPTGEVAIFDFSSKSIIVKSKDFYFSKKLCTTNRGEYDMVNVNETEWFEEYVKSFVSHVLEQLRAKFNYSEFFELTIEDSSFTLELV